MGSKAWYKSRTTWYGLIHLIALAALKLSGVDLTDAVGEMNEGLVTAIVAVEGIVIVILRAITSKRIRARGDGVLVSVMAAVVISAWAVALAGCESKSYAYRTPDGATIEVRVVRGFMDADVKGLYVAAEADGSLHMELGDQTERVRADAIIKAMMIGAALGKGGELPAEFFSILGGGELP
jgi:hypothetical protein